jgi:serine/threonine protein kinase
MYIYSQRILREMKLLRHFRSHENIITLLDIMVHNGEPSASHAHHSSSSSSSSSSKASSSGSSGSAAGGSVATMGSGLVSLDDLNVSNQSLYFKLIWLIGLCRAQIVFIHATCIYISMCIYVYIWMSIHVSICMHALLVALLVTAGYIPGDQPHGVGPGEDH